MSSRYEHASLILTSNLPFSSWGGVFGDQAVAAAMIDRIVHHADVLTLKGASYRLRNRGIDTLPSIRTRAGEPDELSSTDNYTAHFSTGTTAQFSTVTDMGDCPTLPCQAASVRVSVAASCFVFPHASDDAVGEVALVGSAGFASGLAFAELAVDVGAGVVDGRGAG